MWSGVWFTYNRDSRYWRLNVQFKILLLDLGTFLIVGQKKFTGRAKTFLNEIILGGRKITAEKGQVDKETYLRFHSLLALVKDAFVFPAKARQHWEDETALICVEFWESMWIRSHDAARIKFLRFCQRKVTLESFMKTLSWIPHCVQVLVQARTVVRDVRLNLVLLSWNPNAWNELWELFLMKGKSRKSKKNWESAGWSRTGWEFMSGFWNQFRLNDNEEILF